MKKLFIAASLLFSVSSFSQDCYNYSSPTSSIGGLRAQDVFNNNSYISASSLSDANSQCSATYDGKMIDKAGYTAYGRYSEHHASLFSGSIYACWGTGYASSTPKPLCPTGYYFNSSCECVVPSLPDYNDDPYECIKHGGFPTGHPVNSSGVSFMNSGFSIKWERKCLTRDQAITDTVPLIAGVTGNISGNPDLLGILFDKGVKKIKDIWNDLFSQGKPITNDYLISLPKYNPTSKTYEAEIIESPIPKGSDGVTPSRSPNIGSDPYQQFLRDEYFPKNNLDSSGSPVINQAQIDNFNTANQIFKDNGTDPKTYTFTPNTANIWGSTGGATSTKPIYDTAQMVSHNPVYKPLLTVDAPTFRIAPPDATFYPPVPVKIADVPVNSTVGTTSISGIPVKQWKNTTVFPDGSSSQEIISIDENSKTGTRTTTVVSPNGSTSTTTESFTAPNYAPGSTDPQNYDVVKNAPVTAGTGTINPPVSSTPPVIDPVTGFPVESNPFPSSTPPTTAVGQDLINAPMPSYSFPETENFVHFDVKPIDDMMTATSDLYTNIKTQLGAAQTTFNDTKALLDGSWAPPVIPAGACGDSLILNFHGKEVDLCPPIMNTAVQFSPIVAPVVTLGGMALSIIIFIGGF